MHKHVCQEKENLLAVGWQPGNFPKSDLSRIVPKAIEDSTPKPTAAYRPPGAKNRPSTFTLHEQEKPHKPGEAPTGKFLFPDPENRNKMTKSALQLSIISIQ